MPRTKCYQLLVYFDMYYPPNIYIIPIDTFTTKHLNKLKHNKWVDHSDDFFKEHDIVAKKKYKDVLKTNRIVDIIEVFMGY